MSYVSGMADFSEALQGAFDTKVDTQTHKEDLAKKADLENPKFTADITVTGSVKAGAFRSVSDRHLKEDIRSMPEVDLGTLKAMKFRFKSNNHRTQSDTEKKRPDHIGLIAQDVQRVVPEAVFTDVDGYLSIEYASLVAILIDKVNKLELEVQKLKEFKR